MGGSCGAGRGAWYMAGGGAQDWRSDREDVAGWVGVSMLEEIE